MMQEQTALRSAATAGGHVARVVARSAQIAIERCSAPSRSNGCLMASPVSTSWNIIAQSNGAVASEKIEGEAGWTDAWDGYPAARCACSSFLSPSQNPVFGGAFIHSGLTISRPLRQSILTSVATEFVNTPNTSIRRLLR
jgi:hypothetical protein